MGVSNFIFKKLSMLLVIYFLSTLVFDGRKNTLANGLQLGTKGSFAKVNQSSSSASKTFGSFTKFRENIEFLKQKQQERLARLVNVNSTSTVIENKSSLSENLIQPAPVDETSKQQVSLVTHKTRSDTATGSFSQQRQIAATNQIEEETNHNQQMIHGLVEGVAGVDFPGLSSIPYTKFACSDVPYEPGMYADESTGCQVYHLCFDGRRESFICSVGTVFNQANLACDFWHQVDCSKSSKYYDLNLDFGKSSAEPATSQSSLSGTSSKLLQKSINLPPKLTASQQQSTSFASSKQEVAVQQPPASQITTSGFASQTILSQDQSAKGGQVARGKTTQASRRVASNGRGFLSPGRHVKLMNHLNSERSVNLAQHMQPESSNLIRMTSEKNASSVPTIVAANPTTKTIATSLKVSSANNSANTKHQPSSDSFENPAPGEPDPTAEGMPKDRVVAEVDDSAAWRPYFMSKLRNKTGSNSRPTSSPNATTSAPSAVSTQSSTTSSENDTELEAELSKTPPSTIAAASSPATKQDQTPTAGFSSTMQSSLADSEMEANIAVTTQAPESGATSSQVEYSFGEMATNQSAATTTQAPDSTSTIDS